MRGLTVLLLAAWAAGAAGTALAGELQCRTYWKNSLSGMKAYTDCSDDPYYVPSESEGISWFYGFRRMNKFWDDKRDGLRYNRDFFLKTGMTPAEADGLMRARDAGAAAAGQMAPDKINLDLAGLASSELFVYSSTAAQKGLAGQFYDILMAQPQIAAKTTDKDRSELRGRLSKLSPDLARLRNILDSFVSGETPRLGIGLGAFRAANPGAEETSPNVYTESKEQEAVPLKVTRRFLDGKLISAMLSFAPLANSWVELEQLRLLLNQGYGWPLSCAARDQNEISCRWEDKAGNTAAIGSLAAPEGGREITVTLISIKAITDLVETPGAAEVSAE
ncbi:MAG: hypothetical protein Q7R35_06565 [Elusimicrobiota bacterium]|nr:hypothetical protein [Elusimicrobiota bacterium]